VLVEKIGILVVLFALWNAPSAWSGSLTVQGSGVEEATVQPGEKIEGKIAVSNPGNEAQNVLIKMSDYLFFANGKNLRNKPGSDPRSNGQWVSFVPNRLTIPPKGTEFVKYSILVPNNGNLKGTYWSMLFVETLPKNHPEFIQEKSSVVSGKTRLGIQFRLRYGVLMITHIGITGTKALRIIDKSIASEKGNVIFRADIENSGERLLRPTVWIDIFDKGQSLGHFKGEQLRIFPGCSARFSINLAKVPKGAYTSLLTVDTGDESIIGAKYQLDIK